MNEIKTIPIGKLLRADNRQFVAGCRVKELDTPALGALVKVRLQDQSEVYGLITRISISDDGLVRQLASGMSIPPEYAADNRHNRNLPVEIEVLALGFAQDEKLYHQLPPRPPLSLDVLYLCDDAELVRFTGHGKYAYLRHILRLQEMPVEEILVSHLSKARQAHEAAGNHDWYPQACEQLVILLREDYPRLTTVLDALSAME